MDRGPRAHERSCTRPLPVVLRQDAASRVLRAACSAAVAKLSAAATAVGKLPIGALAEGGAPGRPRWRGPRQERRPPAGSGSSCLRRRPKPPAPPRVLPLHLKSDVSSPPRPPHLPGVVALEEDVQARRAGAGGAAAPGAGAPAALHSLHAALERARYLLVVGGRDAAADPNLGRAVQVRRRAGAGAHRHGGELRRRSSAHGAFVGGAGAAPGACEAPPTAAPRRPSPQALLQGHTQGRDLGPLLASSALAVWQLVVLWAQTAVAEEEAVSKHPRARERGRLMATRQSTHEGTSNPRPNLVHTSTISCTQPSPCALTGRHRRGQRGRGRRAAPRLAPPPPRRRP
jgi:hypothetical protein